MIQTADVAIIGAGVHGASLAFHLARRGARVVVLAETVDISGYSIRRFAEDRPLVGEHPYGMLWR